MADNEANIFFKDGNGEYKAIKFRKLPWYESWIVIVCMIAGAWFFGFIGGLLVKVAKTTF